MTDHEPAPTLRLTIGTPLNIQVLSDASGMSYSAQSERDPNAA
jgi:hypothetical protein